MKCLKFIVKNIFLIFFTITIFESHIVNKMQKRIYICNHISVIDAIIIALFLEDDFCFVMGKNIGDNKKLSFSHFKNFDLLKGFFINRVSHFLSKISHVIKVDTTSPYSVKEMINVVNSGKALVIFPEGAITRTGVLEQIQDGAGFIADKTDATIIPLYLDGLLNTYFSYISGKKNIFGNITLEIREPFKFEYPDNSTPIKKRKIRIEKITKVLQP